MEGHQALVPYISAGDPDAGTTLALMHGLVDAGASVIELGVPFSDPMADGPVIQRAGERALGAGMTLGGVLDLVARFRADDATTPVVLMGYLNPIEAMGYERFAAAAREAGVDGSLVVDMPPEEATELLEALDRQGVDPIFLLAPTTSQARVTAICERARGYVYYVSLKGVTGSANLHTAGVADKVASLRALTPLPIGVGFGIRDAATASAIARVADAVVVGTAVVGRVEEKLSEPEELVGHVCEFVREMSCAVVASREEQ